MFLSEKMDTGGFMPVVTLVDMSATNLVLILMKKRFLAAVSECSSAVISSSVLGSGYGPVSFR